MMELHMKEPNKKELVPHMQVLRMKMVLHKMKKVLYILKMELGRMNLYHSMCPHRFYPHRSLDLAQWGFHICFGAFCFYT